MPYRETVIVLLHCLFLLPVGFSLKSWKADRGFVSGHILPEYAILQLKKDLGVAGYLREQSCNTSSTHTNGWQEGIDCVFNTVKVLIFAVCYFFLFLQ